jgi:regulator of protease activity HflC (stomatin/prohibitin superfamily)
MKTAKLYHFDRGKIFYPYVMNYIYSIHGFVELLSRGIVDELREIINRHSKEEAVKFLESIPALKKEIKERIFNNLNKGTAQIRAKMHAKEFLNHFHMDFPL